MKKLVLILCLVAIAPNIFAARYVFFLHNMYTELYPLSEAHPEYGKVEYYQILDAFKNEGFVVISEIRPKGTEGKVYARKVVRQVDSLLSKGVKPEEITVVGTSKGGYIAQYVSTYLKNDKVNFVFIGCCMADDAAGVTDINYCGSILSIYEKSDNTVSCTAMKNKSTSKVVRFKEIVVNTGLRHGFLYKALPVWLEPTIKWAKQIYD